MCSGSRQGTEYEQQVHEYVNHVLTESSEAGSDVEKAKTGVPLGRTVTNPVNGEQIPMYVADYVLMEYGTGAIMAVPAHDQRDYDFAKAFDLPIRQVVAPEDGESPEGEAFVSHSANERLINSGQFTGMHAVAAKRGDRHLARPRGHRPRVDQLQAARLAAVPPALLGLSDPDHLLRAVRHGAGARRRSSRRAPRSRGLPAARTIAPGGGRGLGQHRAARIAMRRRVARPTRWTRSSTRAGTSSATAMPATTTPRGTGTW